MFSVLNVYKPLELTSHDVVSRLRKIYQIKKIGHLGTLDPLAEGVLPVCIGQATRLIEYFPSDKQYVAEVTFGITTSTLDREGEILSKQPCQGLTPEKLEAALQPFIGTIAQRVPLHSAVHVGGKKLYEYAHKGQVVETPTKTVTIYGIQLLELRDAQTDHPVAVLKVDCASGTYIRSLARDIGEALGCGAYLSSLVRTRHGQFTREKSIPLETLQTSPTPHEFLEAPAPYLGLPVLTLESAENANLISHGMKIELEPNFPKLKGNQHCYVEFESHPLSIMQVEGQKLKPLKVFNPL